MALETSYKSEESTLAKYNLLKFRLLAPPYLAAGHQLENIDLM